MKRTLATRTYGSIAIAVLVACITPRSSGQSTERITLQECLSAARESNQRMKIADARVASAQAKTDESGSAMLPQLKFTGRAAVLSATDEFSLPAPLPKMTLFQSIEHSYSAKVSLQQPVFMGFRLQKSKEANEWNQAAAEADRLKDRSDVSMDVVNAYWNLYRGLRIERSYAASIAMVSSLLADIREMKKRGMATDADVLKVEARLSDVKVRELEARSSVQLAKMALNSLMGAPLERRVVPAEAEDSVLAAAQAGEGVQSQSLTELTARALQQRPELRSLEHRRSMSQAGVDAANGGWYPQVAVGANFEYANPNQRYVPPKDQFKSSWDVGITLQWDIWNWNTTGHQSAQASAQKAQAEAALLQSRDAVVLEVAQYYFLSRQTRERIDVASQGVAQSAESYRMIAERFRQGAATHTDVLDAQVALTQAEVSRTSAEVDYVLAVARLNRAAGALQ